MRKALKASRLLGLLAMVLSLMAFGASAAQAQPGAYWLVEGVDIGTTLLPPIQAKDDSLHYTLLTTVGKTPVEILCLEISFKGARLHELGRATGKVRFGKCVTILNKNGTPVANCKPHSPGAASGEIETNALAALLKLHTLADLTKHELLELSPEVGTAFVTIELGALCAIGNKFDITGKFFIKDCEGLALADFVDHLIEEGPLSALLFGTNAATIHGSAWVFLIGAHEGMDFAGHV